MERPMYYVWKITDPLGITSIHDDVGDGILKILKFIGSVVGVLVLAIFLAMICGGCVSPKQMADVQVYRMETNASQRFLNEWGN